MFSLSQRCRFLFFLLLLAVMEGVGGGVAMGQGLYINYDRNVDARDLVAYRLSIIHPDAPVDTSTARAAGNRVLAYLSAAEIASDASYRDRAKKRGVPLPGRNKAWNSDLVDTSSAAWRGLFLELAGEAAGRFDGFFLDTMDSVDLLAAQQPAKAEAFRAGLADLVHALRKKFPDKMIVINRGFTIYDRIRDSVDGVLAESLYQTFDEATGGYRAVPDPQWLEGKLDAVKADGKAVYVVDYVSPSNLPLAQKTASRIAARGYVPLISTPALDGVILAPMRPISKKMVALYGKVRDPQDPEPPFWPSDSWIAKSVQLPLEWMGYTLDYADVANDGPPENPGALAGILVDRELVWSAEQQAKTLRWLVEQKNRGVPIAFFGALPFDGAARKPFLKAFGMTSDDSTSGVISRPLRTEWRDHPITRGEVPVRAVPSAYTALTAPAGSEVLGEVAFQPVGKPARTAQLLFIAPWGGAALTPLITFTRPDNIVMWSIDIFEFLRAALRVGGTPAADVTTADGLRLFFSHIDADGFSNISEVEPGRFSAEVIRDHILARYPVPITSSVIEAEVRGFLKDQPAGQAEKLQEIARGIFAMPNIRTASHTYSHPFYWMNGDLTESLYEVQALQLGVEFDMGKINPEREVRGSVEYINKNLAPPDKPVEVLLWSGNCRPGPEAIAITDELGIENLNGGDTIISRARPTLNAVAPLAVPWGDRLQINTAVQNEMLFTNGFKGPRWGGYANVITTFEKTGSPRRLKPVNIYFHMFMADRAESLNSLKTVFDWAMAQPLQSTTAARYATSVRQARETRFFETDDGAWVVVRGPQMRTVRFPDTGLKLDMARSQGVLGARSELGCLYVALASSPRAEIRLAAAPEPHWFLVSSTAAPLSVTITRDSARLTVRDFRPVTIVLGGIAAGSEVTAVVNGEMRQVQADDAGQVTIACPSEAEVEVRK